MKKVATSAELLNHIISNTGQPLTEIEICKILVKLSESGISKEEIVERTGFSKLKVSRLLNFNKNASEEVKTAVENGDLSFTAARNLSNENKGDEEKQNEILSKAKKEKKEGEKISSSDVVEYSKAKKKKLNFEKTFSLLVVKLEERKHEINEQISSIFYMINEGLELDEIIERIPKIS